MIFEKPIKWGGLTWRLWKKREARNDENRKNQ